MAPARESVLRLEILDERRLLAPVTVDTWADVADGATTSVAALLATPGADGKISLREAIMAANNTAGVDTVSFNTAVFTSTNGVADHPINLAFAQLAATDDLTVVGLGADKTVIDANAVSRILDLGGNQTLNVSLSGLWFRRGKTVASEQGGGAIRKLSPFGTFTIDRCQITDSVTEGDSSHGGGILTFGALTLTNSTVARNEVHAPIDRLAGSGLSRGGGIAAFNELVVTNSTVSSNWASYFFDVDCADVGGDGVYLFAGASLVLTNSTVESAIAFEVGSIPISVASSIVSSFTPGHYCGQYSSPTYPDPRAVLAVHSLIEVADFTTLGPALPDASGNWVGTSAAPLDAKLGPLSNNGGRTLTHALLPDSPALNRGIDTQALLYDQRGPGFNRAIGGTPDIGAFEVQLAADLVDVTPDPRNTAVASVAINFSEAINGFNLADLSLTCNGGVNLLTGSQTLTTGDNKSWTLSNLSGLTSSVGSYLLTLASAGSGIHDLFGNLLAAGATDTWTMHARSLLAGDANRDGKVDLTDFGRLKQNFGSGTLWEQGDFDGNAKVDLTDFGVLKQNFGKSGQAANASASDEFYARLGLTMNRALEGEERLAGVADCDQCPCGSELRC